MVYAIVGFLTFLKCEPNFNKTKTTQKVIRHAGDNFFKAE